MKNNLFKESEVKNNLFKESEMKNNLFKESEMKKIIIFILILILSISLTSFVWAAGQGEPSKTELKSYVVKAGCLHGTEHIKYIGFEKMKEVLEKESGGRITMEIYPAGQLGTEPEMLDQLKMGTLQFTNSGAVRQFCPELNAFALPFLLKDLDNAERVLEGDLGRQYAKYAEKKGFVIVAYQHNGFRQFTNNVHPIKTPADLKGLKLRVPPMDIMLKTMEALGANVVPIPFTELYMALKTGVVDGEENPYGQILDEKLYEVQKYLTVVNYLYPVNAFVTSLDWWKSLPETDQELISKAALAGAAYTNDIYKSNVAKQFEEVKKLMEVYVPTEEELNQFREKVQPVYDWAIGEHYITQDVIDQIRAMAE